MSKKDWFTLIPFFLTLIAPLVWWQQGLSVWGRKAILFTAGELIGWFGFRFYQDQFRNRIGDIFSSAFFQILFLFFSFWLVVSSVSYLAYGLVLGINYYLLRGVVGGLVDSRSRTRERLFGPDNQLDLEVYAAAVGLGVALLYLLVLI